MIAYVETNFVLEHALGQEQFESCERILALAEKGVLQLALPAFSVPEAQINLRRGRERRAKLQNELAKEVGEMQRSKHHDERVKEFIAASARIVEGVSEDTQRLDGTLVRVRAVARVIPLDEAALAAARKVELEYGLSPQDSLVLAAVLADLATQRPDRGASCFLTRNDRDFDDPDIRRQVDSLGCRMIFRFDKGLEFIDGVLSRTTKS